jgi:hypothetical protein
MFMKSFVKMTGVRHAVHLLLILSCNLALALPVSQETARDVALNWHAGMTIIDGNPAATGIDLSRSWETDGIADFYLFSFEPAGFVIVSGDDATIPVIGYSHTSRAEGTDYSPALGEYFDAIQAQLEQIRTAAINNSATLPLWQDILNGIIPTRNREREVAPLLSATWHQGCGWNDDCPEDSEGPCERVWAGCVATAMCQIMKYWAHPEQGEGTHRYNHPDYGLLEADFGATTYDWNRMHPGDPTAETAELLFHFGVAVEMDYGPDGSGVTLSPDDNSTLDALSEFFRYDSSASYVEKENFSDREWNALMETQLDADRPVFFVGYNGYSGHAFVLDGYDRIAHFHVNWGWGGNFNGYFYLNDLTPGTADYSDNQCAIVDIFPAVANTPVIDLAIAIDDNDVVLEWSAVTGAIEYNIYRLDEPHDPEGTLVGTTRIAVYRFADELLWHPGGFYVVRVEY